MICRWIITYASWAPKLTTIKKKKGKLLQRECTFIFYWLEENCWSCGRPLQMWRLAFHAAVNHSQVLSIQLQNRLHVYLYSFYSFPRLQFEWEHVVVSSPIPAQWHQGDPGERWSLAVLSQHRYRDDYHKTWKVMKLILGTCSAH